MKGKICDCCGDLIYPEEEFRTKIKVTRKIGNFEFNWWEKLDICQKCQEDMISWINANRLEKPEA